MKAMRNRIRQVNRAVSFLLLVLFVGACDNASDILSASDTQNLNAELTSGSYTDESADISTSLMSHITNTQLGARVDGNISINNDDRLSCATITLTPTGTKEIPQGIITIDFGSGCTDNRGVTRTGIITIAYHGKRWMYNSYRYITFSNFKRNGVQIDGKDSVINTTNDTTGTSLTFKHVIIDGQLTFPDGKIVTRDQSLSHQWNYNGTLTIADDEWLTLEGGAADGKTKSGSSYEMAITRTLVRKASCALTNKIFIPVSGTKTIVVDGNEYVIDYGSGACDNDVTVTFKGKAKTITVNNNDN
jgi:hypothetical protein